MAQKYEINVSTLSLMFFLESSEYWYKDFFFHFIMYFYIAHTETCGIYLFIGMRITSMFPDV